MSSQALLYVCTTERVALAEKIAAVLTLASVVALVCCTSNESPTLAFNARDSAGFRIVENEAPLWLSDSVAWTLEPVPSIEIEGDPEDLEYYLHGVRALQWMADGQIVVANGGEDQLLVFDSLGDYVESVGRPGDGPGEFSNVFDLLRCTNDTLMVYEGFRLSVLDERVRFVRTELIAGRLADGRGNMAGVSSDCSAILLVDGMYHAPGPGEGVHQLRQVLHWSSLAGDKRDTVLVFPGADLYPIEIDGQLLSQRTPFGKEPAWVTSGNLVYFGSADQFEISVFDRRGRMQELIRWTAEAQTVKDWEWDRFAEGYTRYNRTYASEIGPRPPADHFPIPSAKPAFAGLLVDDTGNLWVRQYQYEDSYDPQPLAYRWWIFNRPGRWLGAIETPAGFRVLAVQRGHVMGVVRDDDDVQHVRLYRLAMAGGQ